MISIKPPTLEEEAYIKRIAVSNPREKVRQRAQILNLAWTGMRPLAIAEFLQCDKDTVYRWFHIWNDDGIGAVVTYRQTTTWHGQVKRRQAIERIVENTPQSLGLRFNTWSLPKIAAFLTELVGYSISPTTVWRDLQTLNISYQKVQDTFVLKPIDYDLKRAWLRFIEHFCPSNWRIVYVDEKGPVHSIRYGGHCWSFTRPMREIRQKNKGSVLFLGGFDPHDYQLEMFAMEDDSSYSFRQGMELIRMTFLTPEYNHLLIVMDNDAIHHARATLEFFEDDPQMDYFFLPTYSPELNPIEICFHHYTEELLKNGTFYSIDHIIDRTEDYCQYYNDLRRGIYAN